MNNFETQGAQPEFDPAFELDSLEGMGPEELVEKLGDYDASQLEMMILHLEGEETELSEVLAGVQHELTEELRVREEDEAGSYRTQLGREAMENNYFGRNIVEDYPELAEIFAEGPVDLQNYLNAYYENILWQEKYVSESNFSPLVSYFESDVREFDFSPLDGVLAEPEDVLFIHHPEYETALSPFARDMKARALAVERDYKAFVKKNKAFLDSERSTEPMQNEKEESQPEISKRLEELETTNERREKRREKRKEKRKERRRKLRRERYYE